MCGKIQVIYWNLNKNHSVPLFVTKYICVSIATLWLQDYKDIMQGKGMQSEMEN